MGRDCQALKWKVCDRYVYFDLVVTLVGVLEGLLLPSMDEMK